MATNYTKLFLQSLELHPEKFNNLPKIAIELLKSCRAEFVLENTIKNEGVER